MTGTDAIVERILTSYDTITVVGASRAAYKAAHSVPAHMQRHGWRIIPVNPHADQILGEQVYRTLADVPEQVGLVDVFRPPGGPRHHGQAGGRQPVDVARDPAAEQVEHLRRVLEPDDVAVGHDEHGRRRDRGDPRRGPVLRLCVQVEHLPDQAGPRFGSGATSRYAWW